MVNSAVFITFSAKATLDTARYPPAWQKATVTVLLQTERLA